MSSSTPNDWSRSESAVLDRMRDAVEAGGDPVLVTVVDVEGRAYRREGAKLLRDDTGVAGSVTAGCLTSEIQDLTTSVRSSGDPKLVTFDLMDDENWGLGIGCNGIIELFAEPVDERFSPLLDAHRDGNDGVGLVAIDADESADVAVGERAYALEGEISSVEQFPDWVIDELNDSCQSLFKRGRSATVTVTDPAGSEVRVLIDSVEAPPDLYLFGSGNDVNPVVELAKRAGFRVTVVSLRGARGDPDSFPHADSVITTSAPEVGAQLSYDANSYAVIMSHNAIDDRLCLESLLDTPIQYIGLMGPDERFVEIRDELAADGQELSKSELERIYTPVGLDLGGGDPYQIAISVVSELLAVDNDRSPGHLRDRESPIHDRSELHDL